VTSAPRAPIGLVEQRLKLTSRQGLRFTLIFIDVDNLKYINDNFGHSESDFLLFSSEPHY
jgi:diguanylate cyclase (GGDEF)-like protein